ncbi:unnamed protein product [marine sediment metagenome]|uniref:Uncharacterized protein n=1 Tax=marine sediment metagenome TaxID=412755 RepID=X0YJH8_9ZZZZ
MALQIEDLEVSVSKIMDKLWNITVTLKCTDNSIEVLNQSFSVHYKSGQNAEAKVKQLLAEMQKAIDDFKDEQQLLDSSALATAMTWLQNNLEV